MSVTRDVVPAAAVTGRGVGFADADQPNPHRVAGTAERARSGAKNRAGTHQKMSSIHTYSHHLMPTLSHCAQRAQAAMFCDTVASQRGYLRRRVFMTRRNVSRRNIPDRKSTRLNSSHLGISYAVFCL